MTTTTAARDRRETRERRWAPEEGWSVLALVLLVGLVVATAIDEPAWVNGRGALTHCLAWCAVGGALVGFAGPKLGWGRWTTHVVGALLAGLLLPVIAGWAVDPGIDPVQAFQFTAFHTLEAYLDLTVRGFQFTTQEAHYVLVLGGLVWGTMQFGSYAVFGHRRPLSAVVVVGLVLLANMALTRRDQLGWLVLYAALSLFLLIQMHAFGERSAWTRRRIGDPGSLSLIYLRGGTIFIVAATFVALILTQRAASSPLAGAWSGLNSQLVQLGKQIGRLLPAGGEIRGVAGVSFGNTAQISSQWFSDDGVAFTASVPAEAANLKFRAATYDTFTPGGFVQGDSRSTDVPPGTALLAGSPEVPSPALEAQVTVTVDPMGFHDSVLLSPGLAASVNESSTLQLRGVQGWFVSDTVAPDRPYTVTALVPRLDGENGITGNKLLNASTQYPGDVTDEYTQLPPNTLGPYAKALLAKVIAQAGSTNPYALATTMEQFFQTDYFQYTTDVTGINCGDSNTVECFAQYRKGYCLHYATTMAVLLRAANPSNPIPTRLVQGFLSSKIVNGQETIRNKQAHAWVEVFFPGYGWVSFDPTGGGVSQPESIPLGPPVPTASIPLPSGGTADGTPRPTRRVFEPGAGQAGSTPPPSAPQPTDRLLAALIAVLLAGSLGALIVAAWYRGPRGEVSADTAWTAVSTTASRFGFAPRPTQTVYEYASSLADLVPMARPDITVIADAKVEATYARVELTPEREHAVAAAMRRLRVSLVRLLFMRGKGRARRG